MSGRFYRFLTTVSRWIGSWFFALVARGIATGYLLLAHRRRRASCRFYRIIYPHRNRCYHLWCAWRQFLNFTDVYRDRFLIQNLDDISFATQGLTHLETAARNGCGAVMLMSHMGNWEVAARLLKKSLPRLPLLLYMGARPDEEIEHIQKNAVRKEGITVIVADKNGGSPLDIVAGVSFLGRGGVVSMAGDMLWRKDQKSVPAAMFGRSIRLPEAPFLLALVSGAPLIVFFAFRIAPRRYRFIASPPIPVTAASREERTEAIRRAAQLYADRLEEAVRRHPYHWYHFNDFLGQIVP